MNTSNFVQRSADEMEGDIGGCAMDSLRENDLYFEAPVDPYAINWFVSRERSAVYPEEPRYALAVHGGRQFMLDLDEYTVVSDADEGDLDNLWRLVPELTGGARNLTTADCTKFLTTDAEIQKMVRERYEEHLEELDEDEVEERAHYTKLIANSSNPKKWKRRNKYSVGSKIDIEGGNGEYGGLDYGQNPDYAGGIIRIFWLEDTDNLTLALLEKDGQLKVVDDLSD